MIEIIPYSMENKPYFERLNRAWLTKYFTVEPIDEYVLTKPEEAILNEGGYILFAEYKTHIIGTVALKSMGNGVMELTKMAVDESYQGLGAGKLLCNAAITLAKDLAIKKLILYSQTKLAVAIGIYRKFGFKETPLEIGIYERADIKMELSLNKTMEQQQQFSNFAKQWIQDWNDHNLENILSHYSEEIQFTSPIIQQLGVDKNGSLHGKESLKKYFSIGLEKYPQLTFHLIHELTGLNSVVIFYKSINNTYSAEFMEFDEKGKVKRVHAHYTS
jgi:ribosomal protein S18 acetylase RimI-like enzyme